MNFHTLIAQESKSTTHIDSSRTQQDINRTNSPNKKNKKNILGEPFTDYYSTQTTYVHSIAVGSGDKFSFWYNFMAPLIRLERMKYVSFGAGFGGKAVSYLTYKQDGELVNDTERAYFFFFGGSAGLTFFITQRIFLHFAGGAEYWFGDTPSGYGYIYEYRDGYDESGGWKPMYTIGLNSILPLSKRSTTSLGLAYSNNSFQYQTFSLVFTFY
jgi:hypothetical protein